MLWINQWRLAQRVCLDLFADVYVLLLQQDMLWLSACVYSLCMLAYEEFIVALEKVYNLVGS